MDILDKINNILNENFDSIKKSKQIIMGLKHLGNDVYQNNFGKLYQWDINDYIEISGDAHSTKVDKKYIYKSPYRPISSISLYLPKGFEYIDKNTFSVNKPISFELESDLQLDPQDPKHPKNIKKEFESIFPKIDELSRWGDHGFQIGKYLYTQDMINGGYGWRVTYFDETGTPSGHDNFKDYVEARTDATSRYLEQQRLVKK